MLNDNEWKIQYMRIRPITFIHYDMSGTTFIYPVVHAFVYVV